MNNRDCCNHCCDGDKLPSGHIRKFDTQLNGTTTHCNNSTQQTNYIEDFYKDCTAPNLDFNTPGRKIIAVGDKDAGDVPYLPSFQDNQQVKQAGIHQTDNLLNTGPFYTGVSETHEKYVRWNEIEPRKFHEYVRHYEEPGLRFDKSITRTDFCPPFAFTEKDKHPCVKKIPRREKYAVKHRKLENPHAKDELEWCSKEKDLLAYIEQPLNWKLSTETGDNYVCYQTQKKGNKLAEPMQIREEIFQADLRKNHLHCPYDIPYYLLDSKVDGDKNVTGKECCCNSATNNSAHHKDFITLTKNCFCQRKGN